MNDFEYDILHLNLTNSKDTILNIKGELLCYLEVQKI